MKARDIIESETGSAREFLKKMGRSDHFQRSLDAIKLEYDIEDFAEVSWDHPIYNEAADKRTGSLHEEGVSNGRPYCAVCGFVDEGDPDPEYHPEFYLDQLR